MTSGHFIFIPAVLAFGFLLGFLFSRQYAQDQINRALKREKEREEARRKRAERKKKKAEGEQAETESSPSEAKSKAG